MLDFTDTLAPLADPTYFAQVTTNPESGTITWPNNADLDPDVLHATVTGIDVQRSLAPRNSGPRDSFNHCRPDQPPPQKTGWVPEGEPSRHSSFP